MRIEVLREFICIADERSFTLASKALAISQPTLSTHMTALERELGNIRLFERSKGSNGVKLTRAGQGFYQDVREVLERYDKACDKVRQEQRTITGIVKCTLSPLSSVASSALVQILQDFSVLYPHIDVQLSVNLPQNLIEEVEGGIIDCSVLVQRCSPDEETFPTVPLCREELRVLVPQDHPLRDAGAVPVTAFETFPSVHDAHGSFVMTELFHTELFAPFEITPRFAHRPRHSLDDFMINEVHGEDLVIMPKSFEGSLTFQMRPDLALLPFNPPLTAWHRVMFGPRDNPAADALYAYLRERKSDFLAEENH